MRAKEFLLELDVGEQRYGSWEIKFSKQPMKSGKFQANAFLRKKNQVVASVQADGKSEQEAIQNAKSQIDQHTADRKAEIKQNIKAADVTRTTIDFNVEVTKVIFNNTEPTAARFAEDGGIVYLDIATSDAMENDRAKLKQLKFSKMHDRGIDKTDTAVKGYGMGITPTRVDNLGLEFNGRYTLDETTSPDPDLYRRFKLLFDSVVQSKDDRMILGVPAITIATWIKGSRDASV